jgi:hypothetical protein
VREKLVHITPREPLRLAESGVFSYQSITDALHGADVVVGPELDRERAESLDGEGQSFDQDIAVTTGRVFLIGHPHPFRRVPEA